MNKKTLSALGLCLLAWGIIYLMIAFVLMEIRPANWSETTRLCWVMFCLLAAGMLFTYPQKTE